MTTKTPKSTSKSGSTKSTDKADKSTDKAAKSTDKAAKSTTKSSQSAKKSTKTTLAAESAPSSPDVSPPASSVDASLMARSAASSESGAATAASEAPRTSSLPSGFVRVPAGIHQLSIAGRVVDARTRKVVARAEISLTNGPAAWKARLAASQHVSSEDPPDRTRSSADGTFRFADLPEGSYTLTAQLPKAGTRYGTVSLQLEVSSQRSPFPLTILALPPTAVEGVVRGAGEADSQGGANTSPSPLAMARVRVMGSGESALTDSDGRYLLHGIEPGTRTLEVSARGFKPAQLEAGVERGLVKSLDVLLERPPLSGKDTP